MPFGRLHEEAAGDSKLLALSNAAWRMWGMGLIYCQKNLTDGFIAAGAIFLWGVRGGCLARVADELCAPQVRSKAPLWSRVEGGYLVHDYLQWNDSREEILKMRAISRDRIARYREQRNRCNAVQNALQQGVQNALQHALPVVRGLSTSRSTKSSTEIVVPNPYSPLKKGTRITRHERKLAEEILKQQFGCRHQPRCQSHEHCVRRVVLDLRAKVSAS